MIQNIVFDMGGVLIHWEPKMFTESFNLPAEEEQRLRTETFQRAEWCMLDEGTISTGDAIHEICGRLPEKLHPYVEKLVLGWWNIVLNPMEGMAQLIGELKAAGYGLYVLSNAAVTFRKYFDRIPGAEYFDGIYVSAEHRLVKPNVEIYESFLDTFSLAGDTCYFIDDRPENVAGAAKAGIRGTVFAGHVSGLRAALRNSKILTEMIK